MGNNLKYKIDKLSLRFLVKLRQVIDDAISSRGEDPAKLIVDKKEKNEFVYKKFNSFAHYSVMLLIIIALFLVSPIIFPIRSVSASTYTNRFQAANYYVSVTASSSLTMELATTSNYATSSVSDQIVIESNVPKYDVYVSTSSANSSLYLDGDPSKASIPSTTTNGTILAGIDTNSWAFSSNGSNFYPVPGSGSEALAFSYDGGTSEVTNQTAYDITYGIKANRDNPNGTYSNTILYSTVADTLVSGGTASISPSSVKGGETFSIITDLSTNMNLGTINFNLTNLTSNDTINCSNTTSSSVDNKIILNCTIPDVVSSGSYNVTAEIPRFGKVYSFPLSIGETFFSITKMQEMTGGICSTATIPDTKASQSDTTGVYTGNNNFVPETHLTDARDGKVYTVRRLADGNCWMVKNLDYNLDTSHPLTDIDSDLVSKSSWTPDVSTSAGDISVSRTATRSIDYGDAWYLDGITRATSKGDIPDEYYEGTFYNWYAVTAGSATSTSTNAVAPDSICPKGWTTTKNNGTRNSIGLEISFEKLVDLYGYGGPNIVDYPINAPVAGLFNSGSRMYISTVMKQWSGLSGSNISQAVNTDVSINSSGQSYYPAYSSDRALGASLRCVVK